MKNLQSQGQGLQQAGGGGGTMLEAGQAQEGAGRSAERPGDRSGRGRENGRSTSHPADMARHLCLEVRQL